MSCLLLHFSLILAVSCRDLLSDLSRGFTWLPHSLESSWQSAEELVCKALGMSLPNSNLVRGAVSTYLHGAGIEGGYGFFAPAIPNSSKVVFEMHYEDGHVEYDLPHLGSAEAGVRFIALLDNIGQSEYEPLQEVVLKMLAYSAWQDHPGATTVRTIYGFIDEPTRAEARLGKRESYHFSHVYDFGFQRQPNTSPAR